MPVGALIAIGLLQMLPSLIQAIKGVEEAFAGTPKAGPQKQAVVMSTITNAGMEPALLVKIGAIIDAIVAAFNAAKIFTTTGGSNALSGSNGLVGASTSPLAK